jgi:hypothetical protein
MSKLFVFHLGAARSVPCSVVHATFFGAMASLMILLWPGQSYAADEKADMKSTVPNFRSWATHASSTPEVSIPGLARSLASQTGIAHQWAGLASKSPNETGDLTPRTKSVQF